MTEEPENVNETANEIINEETSEEVNKIKTEETKQEIAKEPTKEEDEQFKNKTDRLKNKKVKCEGCNMEMTLKTLRYSHKCAGKTEDKAVKPRPKAKAKVKAVAIQPMQNEVIEETEPTYLKEVKQKIIKEPTQPVIMKTPQEQIYDNYKLLHQEYMNKKKEKADNLFQNMFAGNLRKKKR